MSLPVHHPFRSPAARDRFLAHHEARAARWPVPFTERFVETSLGKTFVRVSGPEGAPPLVLLHGAAGSSLHWTANVEAYVQRFRVFAVDGIYDSGKSVFTQRAKDGGELARWLGEVLAGLGLTAGVHLVGLSYGGWIAAMYALRFPQQLRSLVLIAPAATVLPLSGVWLARAIGCAIPARFFTASFLRWMLADTSRQGEAGERTTEEWVDDAFLASRCFAARPMLPPTVLTDDELTSLRVPTLFLVGENEKLYSASAALARLRQAAPHIEAQLIAGAGHDLTIAQPSVVNEQVIAFSSRFIA